MKAPFPWMGGKRRVAPEVWSALGDVDNYVEPFAGSLAVLLERPPGDNGIVRGAETVNDADRYLANLWRAIAAAPEDVAKWSDWPVNEADLFARHLWLVSEGRERLERIDSDPDFYDAKIAGWWMWGCCAWIGSGWCSGTGPWTKGDDQRPHLGTAGQGVNRQLPHLGNAGQGAVNGSDMTHGGSGAPSAEWDRAHWREGEEPLVYGYMRALQSRLRRVRVCCGDWSRVVTDGAMAYGSTVGVFLDPPYSYDVRTANLYATDDGGVAVAVREWCIAHGDDHRLRIALCGYEGEHVMPDSWRVHSWKSSGAYLGGVGGGVNRENRHKERIWFSPGCLRSDAVSQIGLFAEVPR
jgi:hypothetical protein